MRARSRSALEPSTDARMWTRTRFPTEQSRAIQSGETAPPRRPAPVSGTFALDGVHTSLFTPIVPPPSTGKTSELPPTVVEPVGFPAVIHASVLFGAFGRPVNGPAQPPLATTAYGSF